MKVTDFLREIEKYPKPYYRLVDWEKIFGQDRATINKAVNRLVTAGLVKRLLKDVYVAANRDFRLDQIAALVYQPSYVSLETILHQYGVINQPPYGITLVTTRRTKKLVMGGVECWYSQIKPELWWGFENREGVWQAELEKAIVDMGYLKMRGARQFETDEWHTTAINKKRLREYWKRAELRLKLPV
jgi:predicted transcriptional regulator of viral defense system